MRCLIMRKLVFIFVSLLWVFPAEADEILLKNGDLLSGEIVHLEGKTIIMKTSYAGEIKVEWQEVICVTTDRELTFLLKTKEILKGRATCPDDGRIQLEGEKIGRSEEFSLADLEAIYLKPPPTVKYTGSVTLGGSLNKGNTDKASLNSAARFQARGKRQRVFFEGKYNYGESDGVKDEENWLFRGKYDFFVTKKFYTYAQTLLESDDFQDLNLRSTAGVGVGYQILDTDRTKLSAEAGPSYVNEDYDEAKDNRYAAARWSVRFEFDIVPERIKLFHLDEGFYSLEESDTWFVLTEQGVRFTLVENFFANFEFDYKYNNSPAPGNKKSDYAYIIGVGYALNF